jgi:multiple sugar transport system substrate-binding protein
VRTGWQRCLAALAVFGLAMSTVACGDSSTEGGGGATGQTLTVWTRAATEAQTRTFVEAYNKLGRNKVELTVVPNDSYLQQVSTAAGGRNLPDVLGADVVYAPNFIKQGFFQDISGNVTALPFAGALAKSHVDVATESGKTYAVPHTLDVSAVFYNKVLYRKAGLDPEKPPATLAEMAAHAAKIQRLGGGVSGSYFGGNCPGCALFTMWPSIWADGGDVLSADGTKALLDSPQATAVFEVYRRMAAEGAVPEGVRQENGNTWVSTFATGKIGVGPMGSTMLRLMNESPELQIGVAPIRGLSGAESTFVGGDVIGVSSTTKKTAAAWDFIAWTLSDQTQLDVLAARGDVLARTDLAGRAPADERVAVFNEVVKKGRTPKAVNFGATFNDPQGPWLAMIRGALFGPDLANALRDTNPKVTALLSGKS